MTLDDGAVRQFFGMIGRGSVRALHAPARINVLGEHVDYVEYIPTASITFGSAEHGMTLYFRPDDGRKVSGTSAAPGYAPGGFSLDDGPQPAAGRGPEESWLQYLEAGPVPEPHWLNYARGAAFHAPLLHPDRIGRGIEFHVDSSIPPRGGASSSSALTVLAGAALRQVNSIAWDPQRLAVESTHAEWFVGTRGGAMDHETICLARADHYLHLSYDSNEVHWIPARSAGFRWMTFFSHPADKGLELRLEFDERAAVSRLIIPAILDGWRADTPGRAAEWDRCVALLKQGSLDAVAELEKLTAFLPQQAGYEEWAARHPSAGSRCETLFPALVAELRCRPLDVRSRAQHHLGEVRRVLQALECLREDASAEERFSRIGELLNESHASLRDRYEISTPGVEQLAAILRSTPGVAGARLMGGGFGGNVLALVEAGSVRAVVERVQAGYYAPDRRDARREQAVMISTPGEGVVEYGPDTIARAAVRAACLGWQESPAFRAALGTTIDRSVAVLPSRDVQPVIIAAGKGTRARESGLTVPKPVAKIAGTPVVRLVSDACRSAAHGCRPPIIVVSEETEPAVRAALEGSPAVFVRQPLALGTGDAVRLALETIPEFSGHLVIVWGTQPVLRAETIRRALRLAALYPECTMVVPTAVMESAYAPLVRDEDGHVSGSLETRMGHEGPPGTGESNVGMFVAAVPGLRGIVSDVRRDHWNEKDQRYDRPRGEFGFPNEVIPRLARTPGRVLACPIADPREEKGIKGLADVATCERYIDELSAAAIAWPAPAARDGL
jgi:galactokinase/CTP:molybdopterin cytidylyltransferase MocA